MTDPRTEARRRLAEVLVQHQRLERGPCLCGWFELGRLHSVHVADAILAALFPHVEWRPWCMSHAVPVLNADRSDCPGAGPHDEGRELVLRGGIDDLAYEALEPVVPEEPQP